MIQRYQIQEQISQGGVGAVFRAWDSRLQRTVAIKRFLAPELRSDGGAIDPDLMREATVLSSMQHPNIVSIYDVLPDEAEGPCVVMEYLNGKDLEHAVMDAATTVEDFYKIANQTLDALSNAHRLNLLHRDIKPANIQVTWMPNGNFMCKFVDFGLARFFEKPSKQTVRPDGTVMGSVYYMAPEQLERRDLDGRTDLYSLGCVFYYVLSMNRPFQGASVQDVITAHLTGKAVPLRTYRPQLPAALCDWVHWLMQRRPGLRPQNASEALTVLQQIARGESPALSTQSHPRNRNTPSPFAARSQGKGKGTGKKTVKSNSIPGKRPASASPLRWAVPSLSAVAVCTLSLFAWHRWQVQLQTPSPRTAGAIIAAAREAAAKVNATASSGKTNATIPPSPPKEPAVASTLR